MIQDALTGQYRAGLAMLRECIALCPDDIWAAGVHPRATWRIAYHAIFYTHLYLSPTYEEFEPWPQHQTQAIILWEDDEEGIPPAETTFTQADLLGYLDWLDGQVDAMVARLDLDSPNSGFSWYSIPKLDHQILNVRHLGVHVGQLQEILYAVGRDPGWVTRR